MRSERTFVGLDVHAWSVTGHGLDAVTGEVWQRKLTLTRPTSRAGCGRCRSRLL